MNGSRRSRRRWALGLVAVAVTAVHGCITAELADSVLALGDGDRPVQRMEVDFVRALAPRIPLAPAPQRRRAAPRTAAPPVADAASAAAAAAVAASAPEPVASAAATDDEPAVVAAAPASAPMDAASAVADAASSPEPAASAATPSNGFEWPPSTRLSYDMTGDFRGPIEGTARVQWIRSGSRYQVHLDVLIGPSMAPLATVRLTSDGSLTDAGLKPRAYDQESKFGFIEARRRSLRFEDDHIVMVDGSFKPPLPGVQDAVSQLVQLGWIFATHPERLQAGQSVEVPLALGRRVDAWRYEVLEPQDIETALGMVKAWPVRPAQADGGGNPALKIESWIAPAMQYLPVRIHVDIENGARIDLKLSGKPMQAP